MDLRQYTRETLRGLPGVLVIVENIKEDAEASGLSVTELQTDVELKLAAAGIHVLPHEEWRTTMGRPWLYVSVNTIRFVTSYFFSIDLQLKQEVALRRHPAIMTSCATWELGSIGFVGEQSLSSKIRESVAAYVDDFIADYRVANADA
ncbi:MAG: hypothetical protein FJY85_19945 [Deltaproteobacteria bacterium]|nr:hypothetical protein [Deltaproteobacteria bacterium]